jgi:hypothetical protein
MADRILMGSASVARVVESQVDGLSVALFPQTPSETWDDPAGEFAPTFWNADGWRIALQSSQKSHSEGIPMRVAGGKWGLPDGHGR